ncbi:cytochrome c oxidase assembly factor Coa1 family protein [Flavobacterium cerinum]|uniref:Uncharacterized protein n=1 Tax=Flavobacterium cerinum TaxID=2502784 RepID=A0A444HDL7_9FLAO|nr:cytochrome c oxidase assembly factor Coa1 family protein [Flavobacterium cerinum]RWX02296.1 hypothetical protein EPI11_03505 [Flavobacterium cerinum]
MDNEILQDKNWLRRNRKWIAAVVILFAVIGAFFVTGSGSKAAGFAKAYVDTPLYENAVKKSNKNKEVLSVLGKLEPVNEMAILESNVEYGEDNTSVNLSVRVQGNKGKGKMDVTAVKKGKGWEYKKIKIRIKQLKQEIVVLQ